MSEVAEDLHRGGAGEVFRIFLQLGLTSFGGPIAHLGYYRHEFVERRQWLNERAYADLVALCQFLPGPASSQVGFSHRADPRRLPRRTGGLARLHAAFRDPFSSPFAYGAGALARPLSATGFPHGLKLVAVAIVAQAVLGMARNLCFRSSARLDRRRSPFSGMAV